jgi:hypothetical protein
MVLSGLIFSVAFSMLVISPFEGSNDLSLAEIVPGDVQVFISQSDLAGRYQDFEGSSTERDLLRSRRLRQLIESPFWRNGPGASLDDLGRQVASLESQIGFELLNRRNLFDLVGKEWGAGGVLSERGDPETWIFATRIGFRVKLILALFLQFGETFGGMTFFRGDGTVGLDLQGYGAPSLFMGRVQDIFVVGNREDLVAGAVLRARGEKGESVSSRSPSTLRENRDQLLSLALSPPRVGGRLGWMKHLVGKDRSLPLSVFFGQSGELLNLSVLKSLEGSFLWPKDDRRRLTIALRGLVDFEKVALRQRDFYRSREVRRFQVEEILPDSVAWYRVSRVSMETTWNRWLAGIAASSQANTMRSGSGRTFSLRTEVDRYLSYVEQVLGRPDPIRRELFPATEDELGLVVFPVDYSPFDEDPTFRFPGAAIIVHLSDPQAAARIIEELATQTLQYFQMDKVVRESVDGYEWFRLDVAENIYPLAIRPTFGVLGDYLVFSTHDSIVRNIQSTLAGQWRPLVNTRAYRNAFQGMPAGGQFRSWVGVDRALEIMDDLTGYLSKQAYETEMGREGRIRLRSRLERKWRGRYPEQGEAFHQFIDEKVNEHEVEFLEADRARRIKELGVWKFLDTGAVRIGIRKGEYRFRSNLLWRP